MSEDLKALMDDSEETQLLEFIDEYNKSEDIKKVSMITTNMRSKIQSIRVFCAKKFTDLANLLGGMALAIRKSMGWVKFAALFAIMMLLGGLFFLRDEFAQLFQIFQLDSLLLTMGVMAVSGVSICVIVTYSVVGRLVGYNRDKLYAY